MDNTFNMKINCLYLVKIFRNISKELHCNISEKALYISSKRNYDYFFNCDKVEDESFDESEISNNSSFEEQIAEHTSESEYFCEKGDQKDDDDLLHNKVFTFNLDIYHWEKIQPITRYTTRNKPHSKSKRSQQKIILPKHQWAHILREEVWKKTKMPCSWSFQTHSIKYGDRITCHGSCPQCKADIKILINWPTDKIILCEGFLTNYDPKIHH